MEQIEQVTLKGLHAILQGDVKISLLMNKDFSKSTSHVTAIRAVLQQDVSRKPVRPITC
ncbi:MAG: hypothetical protein QTN59_00140 [Candidatus Electrothrix communis]|nr:hypothetical protein [Desulfobulbus sp. US4]WLE97251.1 MAG: hypothetical protein QTN59_00140 [Candidatus Electrothrix communis]